MHTRQHTAVQGNIASRPASSMDENAAGGSKPSELGGSKPGLGRVSKKGLGVQTRRGLKDITNKSSQTGGQSDAGKGGKKPGARVASASVGSADTGAAAPAAAVTSSVTTIEVTAAATHQANLPSVAPQPAEVVSELAPPSAAPVAVATRPIRTASRTATDIDVRDADEPLAVTEYVEDLYAFLREREVSTRVDRSYMDSQPSVNERMRSILIDWLVEVHLKFKLVPDTLYLTVYLIDKYLETEKVRLASTAAAQ